MGSRLAPLSQAPTLTGEIHEQFDACRDTCPSMKENGPHDATRRHTWPIEKWNMKAGRQEDFDDGSGRSSVHALRCIATFYGKDFAASATIPSIPSRLLAFMFILSCRRRSDSCA
jgi:hypothetical protein